MILIIPLILLNCSFVSARPTHRYATTTVNIRAQPSVKSRIVGQVHWNDKVQVIKKQNKKWYQIKYKGKKRYIFAQYLCKSKRKYRNYNAPYNNGYKSYEDASYITNSNKIAQGKLKKKYALGKYGVYTVNGRYCIAMGSYYATKVGTKIDLVLRNKGKTKILKCILADCKSDKHTNSSNQVHKVDGSIVEFVVKTSAMSRYAAYTTGDVSYAGKPFKGKIVSIRVYK